MRRLLLVRGDRDEHADAGELVRDGGQTVVEAAGVHDRLRLCQRDKIRDLGIGEVVVERNDDAVAGDGRVVRRHVERVGFPDHGDGLAHQSELGERGAEPVHIHFVFAERNGLFAAVFPVPVEHLIAEHGRVAAYKVAQVGNHLWFSARFQFFHNTPFHAARASDTHRAGRFQITQEYYSIRILNFHEIYMNIHAAASLGMRAP